ncbi:hypothetical protein D3879_22465 [Pseudomonas cavernicola]|uniref:Uncharacterized protein n=1 Tax=Pseudomonas cavernicola TaxID=2320866 RepID=A0A418X881_9PSED|nr:hypothetical protein [Pseudomonas cavernicola]RJG08660.1 hypothetical protein D3879_22465 [Pseudomonas cavernicola]
MTTQPVIHTFNTGRQYTAHGQRIAYAELGRREDEFGRMIQVAFADVDRQIVGVVTLYEEPVSPSDVSSC